MIAVEDPARVRSFSCSEHDPGGRERLRRDVLDSQARELSQGLLHRYGDVLRERSHGLDDVLAGVARDGLPAEHALGYPIPSFRAHFGVAGFDPVWPAAAAGLYVSAARAHDAWSATFAQPRRFLCGRRASPRLQALAVRHGEPSGVPAGGYAYARADRWAELEIVPTDAGGVAIVDAARIDLMSFDNGAPWAELPTGEVAANVRGALAILREYAPSYLPWVEGALRYVVPLLPPAPGVRRSHSIKGLHGVVFMSFPASPLKTAETLVHECSHQYFHFAEEWFALANQRDERLYYSSYVRKERTIDRVLIAFHAFANIVLFYRECLRAEPPFAEACEHMIAENLPQVAQLLDYLEHSPGLTAAGRALYEPLAERVTA
jgi:hypothetical protein